MTESGELEARFDAGIDLAKIRELLVQARERAGLPAESICTMNLVAIHFSAAAYERSKPALEAASALHPARLISLIADPKGAPDQLIARVSTVRPTGSAVALDRIVLIAQGDAVRHLESALTGLLMPEVPLIVVWGGRPEGDLLQRAAESADRVIIDSSTRPVEALIDVARIVQRGAPIGDLAWARIFPWQALAAEVLDLPNLREHRGNIKSVQVTCAGEPGPGAALLAGWFQSRVRRAHVELICGSEESVAPAAVESTADPAVLAAQQSEPLAVGNITELRFEAPPAVFTLRREKGILVANVEGDDDGELVHRVRLPPDTPGRLLAMELKLLSGQDDLYAAAVAQAARLIAVRGSIAQSAAVKS